MTLGLAEHDVAFAGVGPARGIAIHRADDDVADTVTVDIAGRANPEPRLIAGIDPIHHEPVAAVEVR